VNWAKRLIFLEISMSRKFHLASLNRALALAALAAPMLLTSLPTSAQPATPPAAAAPAGVSAERESLEALRQTILQMVQTLAEQGVLPKDKALELLEKAQPRAPQVAPGPTVAASVQRSRGERPSAGSEPVRIQFVPEPVKREMREQIKQEVLAQARTERWGDPNTLPDWLDRLAFEGDLRIRFQSDRFADSNTPAALLYDDAFISGAVGTNYADLTNSTVDRNRYRLRARFGVTARLSDEWSANLRFSTGNPLGPVSTSSTSGDISDRFGIKLDRAFARYRPAEWVQVSAGRMPNPYFSTELLYATDLGFDGAAVSVNPSFGTDWKAFGVIGTYMLRENSLSSDRRLTGIQIGAEWKPTSAIGARIGLANYRYSNVAGQSDTTNFGTPSYAITEYERGFRQKGNTLFRINNALQDTGAARWGLASDFNVMALTGGLELSMFEPYAVNLTAEYTRNNGFNAQDIINRTGFNVSRGTDGRLVRLQVGHPSIRQLSDWQFTATYRHLEKDATLDAFTDPDFMFGGTNVKGYTLGFAYGVARNTSLGARWLSGRQIEGPTFKVDTMQLDLNMRF
jgi:hypothetical protein